MLTADPNRAVYDSILDTIGRTPLVRLNRVTLRISVQDVCQGRVF